MVDAVPPLSGSAPGAIARSGRPLPAASEPAAWSPPASPPPGLGAELDAAARTAHELAQRAVELHFEVADGHIRVQVRDGEGRVIREVPPGHLLNVLSSGSAAGLLVDTTR